MAEARRFTLKFEARVLFPVIAIMALLLAASMWVVNYRFNRQMHTHVEEALKTADAVFRAFQKLRTQNLLARFRNVANEPRVKSVAQLEDAKTAEGVITQDLLPELGCDTIVMSKANGEPLARATRRSGADPAKLESAVAASARSAREGTPSVDTVSVGAQLFDLVSVPITLGDDNHVVGVMTFANEITADAAREFQQLTHSEVVLLAGTNVVAATLSQAELHPQFAETFRRFSATASERAATPVPWIEFLVLGQEHFRVLAGSFSSSGTPRQLGYLLLSSYETPLLSLRQTQSMLVVVSAIGMLLSSAVVWGLVRRITQPLRGLRDGAEAVGRGDFAHRVAVTSRDECGELAAAFNQMTTNLRASRAELEQAVETLRATRAQLLQSEKLSAIGEFVAGVTHELNNPLTAVIGFAELMNESGVDERHRLYLANIVSGATRCHKIVQGLLSFARQHPPERKPVNINEVLENTLNFVQYELHTGNIQVTRELEPLLPKVWADPYQWRCCINRNETVRRA